MIPGKTSVVRSLRGLCASVVKKNHTPPRHRFERRVFRLPWGNLPMIWTHHALFGYDLRVSLASQRGMTSRLFFGKAGRG